MSSAQIVQGVGESTGCRFITEVLIKCGIYGSAKHDQEFQSFMYDDVRFADWVKRKNLESLVVRQSFPHGSNMPSLYNWYNRLKNAGFDKVYTILSTRSQPAQIISTIDNGHLKNNRVNEFLSDPHNRIKHAYLSIFGDLAKIKHGNYYDFVVVNLGDLSKHPYVNLRYTLQAVNVPIPNDFDFDIVKENIDKSRINKFRKKHYEV